MNKIYVIFKDSLYLQDKHCGIIIEENDYCILYEGARTRPRIRIITTEEAKLHILNCSFLVKSNPKYSVGNMFFYSCVSVVKQYIGIRNSHIITGNDLFDYLNGKKISIFKRLCLPFRALYYFIYFLKRRR